MILGNMEWYLSFLEGSYIIYSRGLTRDASKGIIGA